MTGKKKRLLMIEDSEQIASRLLKLLEPISNLEIIGTETDGIHGLKASLQKSPDIILLDINLPGMSGLKIIEFLSEMINHPYIIVLSNLNEPYFKEGCLALGANEYYDKSTEVEHAISAVETKCNGKI